MWRVIDSIAPIILDNVRGDIVEIGAGRSTAILAKHAQAHSVQLFSCDIKGTKKLFDDHHVYHCTSFEFLEQYKGFPSIVFLDGCHDYDVVKTEFLCLFTRLMVGGVIFMHDTLPPTKNHLHKEKCSDAYRLRKEIERDKNYMCFTWPYTAMNCGLTMVAHSRACAGDS